VHRADLAQWKVRHDYRLARSTSGLAALLLALAVAAGIQYDGTGLKQLGLFWLLVNALPPTG
jgi:hypothetical protein